MNPAGEPPIAPLPPPTPTSEKSVVGDKPPKGAKKKEEAEPGALSSAHEKKAQQLAGTYAQLGILAMGFNPTAGKIIYISAVDRAREVLRVARHHPRMMKVVDQIISGNDYIALFLGHAGMIGSILALQDKLPETPMTFGLKMQGMLAVRQWDTLQNAMMGINGNNFDATNTATASQFVPA